MFENFELTREPIKVAGYEFDCKNPKAVMFIIHGIGEYAGRYKRMASVLALRGIKCISMDLPGHGISGGVRGDTAPRIEMLGYIDELISYGLNKYPNIPSVLYGHSMGGNLALDYKGRGTGNDLLDGFIISAPWIRLAQPVTKSMVTVLKTGYKIFPKMKIKSKCKEAYLGNLIYVKPYKNNPLVHEYISLRTAYECFVTGLSLEESANEDNGGSRGKPFLLMHGSEDKICSVKGSRRFAQLHKDEENFQYIEWDGYFHEIHNGNESETGEKVIDTIGNFITNEILEENKK